MSEIELVTEILMGVSALGILIWIVWLYRVAKREILKTRNNESDRRKTE